MSYLNPADKRAYMASYNADPAVAAVRRWSQRTMMAALRELARKHPGEYAAILWETRERDPKPEPDAEQQPGRAA